MMPLPDPNFVVRDVGHAVRDALFLSIARVTRQEMPAVLPPQVGSELLGFATTLREVSTAIIDGIGLGRRSRDCPLTSVGGCCEQLTARDLMYNPSRMPLHDSSFPSSNG